MTSVLPDPLNVWEQAARAFELRAPNPVLEQADVDSWRTPGTLAARLTRSTVQTPALALVDDELQRLMDTPDGRLIITMPPQEGKSTRVAKDFPTWVLKHRPWTRIVGASYGQGLANRNGRAIRNLIASNPELGMSIAADNGSASEWQLAGQDGGLVSVGIGAGLTGRPADLMIIDDPIKDRKEADSEVYRQSVWDWWTDVASTRLAPGAQVVLILTRWHDDDLAGRLLAAEDGHLWRVVNIPAQADHDPAKGETDALDRAVGEYLESARGRTRAQWEAIKTRVGSRTWSALYQGRPSSAEGTIFKREHWQFYDQPLWIEREDGARILTQYDDLLISWDMAFKSTAGSDYVAGHVWMRRGADAYLLDRIHGRLDFPATLLAVRRLAARWPQALLKLVEDKANGTAVIAMLTRSIPGLVPIEPDGGKVARATAVSPLVEAHNVWLPAPELCPWVDEVIEEAAAFPTGKHDDDVDAMSQALNRLIVQPLLAGETFTEEDLDDELARFRITPY
ncbi:putative phage terminase large subunit-like protein [Nocardioides massiliensis]|uniref:Phage terminase large subunit-like protein n=3 Tax=Nocardioides massiliensis TaxID=1325935 RepID=A0ABT9NJK3_9ACTN|nr:phage terminase large subunit [Nocardioides massiliensis]MDP9820397.1 putative phage terminase large subunit-like protein [Nocardioides massiliensis]